MRFIDKKTLTLFISLLLAACGGTEGYGQAGQDLGKHNADVQIDSVGYGGCVQDDSVYGDIILPEFIIIANYGSAAQKAEDFYIADGKNWGGDGLVRFPQGTKLGAGDALVIANYPPVTFFESAAGCQQVSFEYAYGYKPDLEIAGWDGDIADMIRIKGRTRFTEGEEILLIDGTGSSDSAITTALELDNLPEDRVASSWQ